MNRIPKNCDECPRCASCNACMYSEGCGFVFAHKEPVKDFFSRIFKKNNEKE